MLGVKELVGCVARLIGQTRSPDKTCGRLAENSSWLAPSMIKQFGKVVARAAWVKQVWGQEFGVIRRRSVQWSRPVSFLRDTLSLEVAPDHFEKS